MLKKIVVFLCMFFVLVSFGGESIAVYSFSMPYYDLQPKETVVRSSFYTSYSSSSKERKHNVKLASKKLNNTLVDVGGEFSFNKTVGERTEQNGFLNAKIILNGEFTDGVGGGVCQVSTTLYNAVLLGGLKITEYHPHSLQVNYVNPSFDAMVNSGSADFRFVNNTHNPIIIKSFADDDKIKITLLGERLTEKIYREYKVVDEINYKSISVKDEKGEYPLLKDGDSVIKTYGKKGLISEGYLVIEKNGKKTTKKIRRDTYKPVNEIIVTGINKK